MKKFKFVFSVIFFVALISCQQKPKQIKTILKEDPLPSWNEGATKQSIISFVNAVTDSESPDFVKPSDRIATFDNDGTLWAEKPVYSQFLFAIDRVRELEPEHPEWKTVQPFKAVLENNMEAIAGFGVHGMLEIVAATHTGMSTDDFEEIVSKWIEVARHPGPRFEDRLYTEMVYQPMLELIHYLKKNEFKVFIVSGGGIEFMRPWTERVYGIPPEQVVGSSVKVKFEFVDGKPVLMRLPDINFINDKDGKPVGINEHIGKRPIFAFGNSDGDREMLQFTQGNTGKTFMGLVHHTDAVREWAYDTISQVGQLSNEVLREADSSAWVVVDMKEDWNVIFPELSLKD